MIFPKIPFHIFLLLFFTNLTFAQLNLDDFQLGGAAKKADEQCIQLVPDVQYTAGSAWYKKPIDLSAPFEMEVCLVLGEKDLDGADGIVFVFHPKFARTGFRGEGMGFSGLIPSLGIEFDTYLNYHLFDPEEDHVAVMVNGQTYHGTNTFQPIEVGNLEDGGRHLMRILWDPQIKQLQMFLDGESIVVQDIDLVTDIFRGNPIVYWGVTAATGRLSNVHEICIKKLIFTDVSKNDATDMAMASTEPVDIPEESFGDIQFQPGTCEFYDASISNLDKLSNYLKDNPGKSLGVLGHSIPSDKNNANNKLSTKRIEAVISYLVKKGIARERLLTEEQFESEQQDNRAGVTLFIL